MKRKITLLLTFALTLSLCGCTGEKDASSSKTESETKPTSSAADSSSNAETSAVDSASQVQLPKLTEDTFPKLDGSTSAIPLDAGIRAAYFGLSQADVEKTITHTTTHGSFERLINGEVDGIYTVPISAEQEAAAAAKNFKLEKVPVAQEGFVFVVNAKNPVKELSQQQIRDIYSGKIKNWKEVGGNDAEIVPFQRNQDSGSQNYMTVFMDGYNLIKAPNEYVLLGMAGILDAIAGYDNGEDAIGYSVYSYASEMYQNENGIRFIAVDGVLPSKETMADGSYPLLSCTYFMYSADAAKDAPVRNLAAYLTSAEGQNAVEQAGYVRTDKVKPQ